MRAQRLIIVGVTSAVLAGGLGFAQVGRGGSQWLTALADAQRTSWVRTDDKISVDALSKPGFELQWTKKLENRPRGIYGLGPGVTASGVTLFVPMSLVTGSSNNVYAIDNDLGYVVWERRFDAPLPRTDGGVSRRDQRWRHAYREARRGGRERSGRSAAGVARWAIGACLASPGKACRSNARAGGRDVPVAVTPASARRCRGAPPARLPPQAAGRAPPAGRSDSWVAAHARRRQAEASLAPPALAT